MTKFEEAEAKLKKEAAEGKYSTHAECMKDADRARSNSGGKTKYDWDRARELYGDGATDRQIAAALGCNPHTVYHWRQRSGYLPKNEG